MVLLLVDRLEERYEHMKKEQQELKQRNIEVCTLLCVYHSIYFPPSSLLDIMPMKWKP